MKAFDEICYCCYSDQDFAVYQNQIFKYFERSAEVLDLEKSSDSKESQFNYGEKIVNGKI